jgi:hypothetical protein
MTYVFNEGWKECMLKNSCFASMNCRETGATYIR